MPLHLHLCYPSSGVRCLVTCFALVTLPLCQPSGLWASDPSGTLASSKSFFERHCVDCHGADLQRAKLRLDTLTFDLHDPHAFETWVKIHDKLAAGQMPPKDVERPPQRELDALTTQLQRELHDVSLDRQRKLGRVPVRRLNNTEYENTVRELVGTQVDLKDLLPEDNSSDGFDNVSAVLDISATHLLRYQQAAERAVRSAIPKMPNDSFNDRRTGREITEKVQGFKIRLGLSCRLQGDSLIIYSKTEKNILCQTAHVPTTGRYRVQISAAAIGTDDKPLAVGLLTDEKKGRAEAVLRDVRDFAPGEPKVVELEVDLNEGQAFVLNMFDPKFVARKEGPPIEEYKGPGILVEWLKIDGPIGPWPPTSYEQLFAGVPLEKVGNELAPMSADPKKDAERLIRNFLSRAFRRPINKEVEEAKIHDPFLGEKHLKHL
mgnify:CR=1 FL=1